MMGQVENMLIDFFKLLTGVDISDTRILRFDPSKITVNVEWEKICYNAVAHHYPPEMGMDFWFLYLEKMPNTTEEDIVIEYKRGYVEYV